MLTKLFLDIQKNRADWLQCRAGSEFEDRFESSLKKYGFSRILPTDYQENEKEKCTFIKKSIQDKHGTKEIDNVFNDMPEMINSFLRSPYGSQNFPDFLLFTKKHVIAIEIKYSSKNSKSPMWNSNLPKANAIYIFGAYGRQDVTFFLGADVLPEDERELMIRFFDTVKQQEASFKKEMKNLYAEKKIQNDRGFSVYVRRAYEQTKVINPNAEVDYFIHPKRDIVESNVIKYCELL